MTDRELLQLLLQKFTSMEQSVATKQDLARVENDQGKNLSDLFDAREVQFDVNERICYT